MRLDLAPSMQTCRGKGGTGLVACVHAGQGYALAKIRCGTCIEFNGLKIIGLQFQIFIVLFTFFFTNVNGTKNLVRT